MTLPEKPEPSVLDYLKGKLLPGKNPAVEIPDAFQDQKVALNQAEEKPVEAKKKRRISFFWQLIIILVMLLVGQQLLEPPSPSPLFSLVFYGCALLLILVNWISGRFETDLYSYQEDEPSGFVFRPIFLYAALGTGIMTAILFTGNKFNSFNTLVWIIAILFLFAAFFPAPDWKQVSGFVTDIRHSLFDHGFHFILKPWSLLFIATLILVSFYRFFRLNDVPLEMISDHAEKLLDVYDVLNGSLFTFFARNTGREAFQMYLSAGVEQIFDTGISFLTLKLGTAIMGLITAIYMYFLGKELGNRRVGMLAFFLCGIGYWPNIISRIGLRFTLYPAFTAPALYYFFRGIRRKQIPDLVLSGVFIGIGLHGYSPFRVVPLLLILGIILYVAHYWKKNHRRFAFTGLVITGIAAVIIFIPLLRYILDQPDMFLFRAMTRVGSLEHPLPGPAWQIFFNNLWVAIIMPFWKNGSIWVHSIPFRPALDIVSAAMLFAGMVFGVLRYIHQRDWRFPFLLISIPFLMLPSILSLAFPDENPCLNRTAGALVPIFILAAQGLDTLLHNIRKQTTGTGGAAISVVVTGLLLSLSAGQNYTLVFDDYASNYVNSAWNTSEMGSVARDFISMYDEPDSVYVVGFPHWVDTRLVAIISGHPEKDYAIWPDQFSDTLSNNQAKLFFVKPEDTSSLDQLRQMYPDYFETMFTSQTSNNDFILFLVPPTIHSIEEVETTVP